MTKQMPLNLHLRDSASFENFIVGDNQQAVEKLHSIDGANSVMCWLWGGVCGKTHLLEAVCHSALSHNLEVIYVSLADHDMQPAMLEGLDQFKVVCIDDIDAIVGKADWEQALFVLCESIMASKGCMVMASSAAPRALSVSLADLRSRLLGWFLIYELKPLAEQDKAEAIRRRAGNRGLEISDEVIRYVLNRYPRDMHALFDLIEQIDIASLAHQRRVTIPFLQSLG